MKLTSVLLSFTSVPPSSLPPHPLSFQMEQVKQDLSRKDTELLGLQTKLETLTNQFSDSKQHIEVLKESLTAKEQRAAILQTEVQHIKYISVHSCPLGGNFFFLFSIDSIAKIRREFAYMLLQKMDSSSLAHPDLSSILTPPKSCW